MRIVTEALKHSLNNSISSFNASAKKGLNSIYLMFGEEPVLLQEAVLLLSNYAKKKGYEREVMQISSHFDWAEWRENLRTQNLFSSKRFIVYKVEGHFDKQGISALLEYAKAPHTPENEDTLLLFVLEKLEPNHFKSATFNALEEHVISVFAPKLKKEDYPKWIKARLLAQKLPTDASIIQTILECTEGNLLAAKQTIEKLSHYYLDTKPSDIHSSDIHSSDIHSVVRALAGYNPKFSIYEWVDCILSGDPKASLQKQTLLRQEGTCPILMLWTLTKEIRTLIQYKFKYPKNEELSKGLEKEGIWRRKVLLYETFLKRVTLFFLEKVLIQAHDTDYILKSAATEEKWQALSTLSVMLTGRGSGVLND